MFLILCQYTCSPPPSSFKTHTFTQPQGLVEAVGLSNYGPQQLARISTYLQKRGVPLAAVQARGWVVCVYLRSLMLTNKNKHAHALALS